MNTKGPASSRGLRGTIYPGYQVRKLVLVCGLTCLAASNDNSFSSLTSRSGPVTGYRIAAVSYSPVWEIGSPPNAFGIVAGDYWTDAAGHAIPWAASKPRQPGDNHHQFTRVILGRVSFSLPMRPATAGLAIVLVVLLFGLLVIVRPKIPSERAPSEFQRDDFERSPEHHPSHPPFHPAER